MIGVLSYDAACSRVLGQSSVDAIFALQDILGIGLIEAVDLYYSGEDEVRAALAARADVGERWLALA